jgi:hypothetical protein
MTIHGAMRESKGEPKPDKDLRSVRGAARCAAAGRSVAVSIASFEKFQRFSGSP